MLTKFERPPRATKHCRHYSYERGKNYLDGGPRCAVGIDLSAPGASFVCMPDKAETRCPCPKREEYTEAEREAWQRSVADGMERLGAAVQALPKAIPLRTGGNIECPNCGGSLRYDRWHRGAEIKCSTEGCCGAHFNIAAGADWPAP